MLDYVIATSRQQFGRRNAVVSEKSMNAVSVFVARAVMVKRQNGVKIASEKKRG
jgi:hypothetical protein